MGEPRNRRWRLLLGLAVAAATTLTGCGEPEPDATVVMREYALGVPAQLEAGTNRLEVVVDGVAHHTLIICPSNTPRTCERDPLPMEIVRKPPARDPSLWEGPVRSLVLGAEWTAAVEVDLQPGSYRMYCGIVNHAEWGMDRIVEVTA